MKKKSLILAVFMSMALSISSLPVYAMDSVDTQDAIGTTAAVDEADENEGTAAELEKDEADDAAEQNEITVEEENVQADAANVEDETIPEEEVSVQSEEAVEIQDVEEEAKLETQSNVSVQYATHVQTYGWQETKADGQMSGTEGQSKRLEGIVIKLANQKVSGDIQYRTHVQTYGWQNWVSNGAMSGTEGQAKRLEAIQIKLTGEMANQYDVYYRVHAQTFGWMGWASNGGYAGTAGYAKRLEGIQIVLVAKGGSAPGATNGAYRHPLLQYNVHCQTYGWLGTVTDGASSGTEGQAKRLEGIHISLNNQEYSGSIAYRTHVQTYGWQGWSYDGAMSGTSGQSKRLEAIQIKLTGEMANQYDVYYRVHAQTFGWMGWAKNGESAGTEGYAKRLESIQIILVAKGGSAPNGNGDAFKNKNSHTHTWVNVTKTVNHPAVTHQEDIYENKSVCVKEAYDEQVPNGTVGVCLDCGYRTSDPDDMGMHCLENGHSSTHETSYKTVHHDAVYEIQRVKTGTKTVTDKEAWTETVVTGQKCSTCGATK